MAFKARGSGNYASPTSRCVIFMFLSVLLAGRGIMFVCILACIRLNGHALVAVVRIVNMVFQKQIN